MKFAFHLLAVALLVAALIMFGLGHTDNAIWLLGLAIFSRVSAVDA